MNTKMAGSVLATASLVMLLSGCAGAATPGVVVHDDLRPAANAANSANERVAQSPREFSAEARRELHSQRAAAATVPGFSAEAMRELKGGAPAPVRDDLSPLRGAF